MFKIRLWTNVTKYNFPVKPTKPILLWTNVKWYTSLNDMWLKGL